MKLKMNQLGCLSSLVVLTVGLTSTAKATISYQVSDGGLETANVSMDGVAYNGILAGGIGITQVGGSGGPSSYVTICTDFLGSLYLGNTYSYNSPISISSPGLTGIDPTWGANNAGKNSGNADMTTAVLAIKNAGELFQNNLAILTSGTTDQKAALQLAIWTALYDTTSAGTVVDTTGARFLFDTTSSAGILAMDWLNELINPTSPSFVTPSVSLLTPNPMTSQGNPDGSLPQELLVATPVPEASTIVAGTLLFLPFALCGLKSLRKQQL
jgi:hypothetical protein